MVFKKPGWSFHPDSRGWCRGASASRETELLGYDQTTTHSAPPLAKSDDLVVGSVPDPSRITRHPGV